MILSGIVIYIATFKAEVGNKLRPKSSFQGPMFVYTYGYSFMFAVAALILCELTGTFAIFLYIRQYQLEWKKEAERQQYIEYLPAPSVPPLEHAVYCKRHGRGRRYSRTQAFSRETSPCPQIKTSRQGSLNVPTGLPLSASMKDLTYYNMPPFSRETTCNTVSTSVDINRDFSRDFSPRRDAYSASSSRLDARERDYSPRLFTYGQHETIFSYDPPMRRITPV